MLRLFAGYSLVINNRQSWKAKIDFKHSLNTYWAHIMCQALGIQQCPIHIPHPSLYSKLVIKPHKFPGVCQPIIIYVNYWSYPSVLVFFSWCVWRMAGERTESLVLSIPMPFLFSPLLLSPLWSHTSFPAVLLTEQAWSFPRVFLLGFVFLHRRYDPWQSVCVYWWICMHTHMNTLFTTLSISLTRMNRDLVLFIAICPMPKKYLSFINKRVDPQ